MNWDDQLPRRGKMRALIPITLALALFWIAVVAVVWVSLSGTRHTTRCTEDMACWDCKTMGNHICGPVAPDIHVGPPPAVACLKDGRVVTGVKACPL